MKILRKLFAVVACVALLLPTTAARADTGSGLSANVSVDTRNLTMTGLVITGPSSIPWGSEAAYTATLSYAGAAVQDVTADCEWSVSGGPITGQWEQPAMWGNVLDPQVVSPVPLLVTATVTRNGGRLTSAPFAVTVTESSGINVGIGVFSPSGTASGYVGPAGSGFIWRISAIAVGVATDNPGVTYQWFLDNQLLGTGRVLDQERTGMPGAQQLRLQVTDTASRTGLALRTLVFNPPPVLNEPPAHIPAVDPKFGRVLEEDGVTEFSFDPLKTPNGLIVVTHGLYGAGSNEWLGAMVASIRARLVEEERPMPNIVILDWGLFSNPSATHGFDLAGALAVEQAEGFLLKAGISASSFLINYVADFLRVRPEGLSMGQDLADWIRTEIENGNIVAGQKIHLIGHSAGGFVVGEAGWQLRDLCTDLRVTMLDTPFPLKHHLWKYPDTGRELDRYVSSAFGFMEYPTTVGSNVFSSHASYSMLLHPPPLLPIAGPVIPTTMAHSYAHEWYDDTVVNGTQGARGFGWSQFLEPPAEALFANLGNDGGAVGGAALAAPPIDITVPITGFTTFGTVVPDSDGFVLTEGISQNAGIMRPAYTFPAGTHSLRFRFRFTTPGDGDFLSVSFGDNPPIFAGKDMPLTRDGELTTDVPVEALGSQQGDLVFRLVSRGQQNAVVTIHGIVAVTVEDADQDGLNNASETALGTNAMNPDTDGDGVLDADEVNIQLTDALRADTDGDGSPDGAELAAGTDPKNPA